MHTMNINIYKTKPKKTHKYFTSYVKYIVQNQYLFDRQILQKLI